MPVPQTEDWRAIAAEFQERWNFPNCIGAIDGKHVVIQAAGKFMFNYRLSRARQNTTSDKINHEGEVALKQQY
ncbi:hypothetical protein JOQ06_023422 [Pogonophryne albipinna]|uniref:DDE Tnp4 domain-containing protein n=1 Tax=Pogonophryne albipinna TaxID=1090488 RepID=A0AAD6BIJ6_9TELE|nr:hypothetical protein JOQ06_023422 [Pogonophryne albipinna]